MVELVTNPGVFPDVFGRTQRIMRCPLSYFCYRQSVIAINKLLEVVT
jgi:hypothetical protein